MNPASHQFPRASAPSDSIPPWACTVFLTVACVAGWSTSSNSEAGPFLIAILSISAMSGGGQGKYYIGLAREDYYTKGGEPPGLWIGGGSKQISLDGTVKPQQLRNLLLGFSPDGGLDLVRNAGDEKRQSGWDLTFSAPKSVSVIWALSSPDVRQQIQRAQFEAATTTLSFLEREAGIVRLGAGGREIEKARLIAAAFEHGTSRAQDPQLHTHVLLLNIGVRADGTTRALSSRPIYRMKMLAGRVYRESLALALERDLSVEIHRTNSSFSIAGVPDSVCRTFSKRREQILTALEERSLTSAIAAKIAALDTRPAKALIPREKLFAVWQEKGKELGFGTREVTELLSRARDRALADREREPAGPRATSPRPTPHGDPSAGATMRSQTPALHESEPTRQLSSEFRTKPSRIFGRVLFKIPLTPFELRLTTKRPFHRAPSFSPAKNFELPMLAIARRGEPIWKPKYYLPKPLFEKQIGVWNLSVRGKYLFPNAPQWTPLHGVYRKVICVSLRPDLADMSAWREKVANPIAPHISPQRPRSHELHR